MKLLIVTQAVDKNDPILGFFHRWVEEISTHTDRTYVIANGVGEYSLPQNTEVFSLGKEKGFGRVRKLFLLYLHLFKIMPKVDGVFIHMCPEYAVAMWPINIFFRKKINMWYAHVRVSGMASFALKHVAYKVLTPSKESFVFDDNKIVSTGHGIDVDFFKPLEISSSYKKKTQEIISVSRISRVKNIEALIDAIHVLVNTHGVRDFYARIIGDAARPEDAEYLAFLKKKVKEYNIDDYVVWHGPVSNDETLGFYQKADIFVRMQAGGGFGKTELEAMACGLPVILPTPVYNDFLKNFIDDLYWEDGDTEGLANCISNVLRWPSDKRQRYSEVSRKVVSNHHSLKKLAKRIVKEFN